MSEQGLYYRFEDNFVDFYNEKEVKKRNLPLTSFDCLSEQLYNLEAAYKDQTKESADIIINAIPEICGVAEIYVCHKIKFKLFSRAVKVNCFSMCISRIELNEELYLYEYDTEDFGEVRQVLEDFVKNKKLPDLSKWKRQYIA